MAKRQLAGSESLIPLKERSFPLFVSCIGRCKTCFEEVSLRIAKEVENHCSDLSSRSHQNPTSYETWWRRFPRDGEGESREANTKLGTMFLFKEWTEVMTVKGGKTYNFLKVLVFKCF